MLAVPVGSTVEFPNNDGIFHNVFSLSGPQPFDLGLYRAGESRQRTFTSPGIYRVFCNIHPQMTAMIVVAPSAFTTVAGAGRPVHARPAAGPLPDDRAVGAAIAGLGRRPRAPQGVSTAPELTLDETAWAFAQHKNKFGKEYPAAAYQK